MFKLVVLSALVAIVAAKPSGLLAPLTYAAPIAVPAAVSHQYRSDVISKPVIATYAAAPAVYSAPITYAAHTPVVTKTVAYGAPLAYAAPSVHAYGAQLAYAAPAIHAF